MELSGNLAAQPATGKKTGVRYAAVYTRWSTPSQREGDSSRRQRERTEAFAARHGLAIRETIVDDGKSAFEGKNLLAKAGLGGYIARASAGGVEPGTVLIVEDFSRFSRMEPEDALFQMMRLLNAGVCLGIPGDTPDGDVIYEKGSLKTIPLLVSIIKMQSAFDYSHAISKRITAWHANRKKLGLKRKPFSEAELARMVADLKEYNRKKNAWKLNFARVLLDICRHSPLLTYAEIAREVNRRGHTTPSGRQFNSTAIRSALEYLAKQAEDKSVARDFGEVLRKTRGGRSGKAEVVKQKYPKLRALTDARIAASRKAREDKREETA